MHLTKEEIENTNGYVSIVILNTLLTEFPQKLDQLLPTFVKILCTELSQKEIHREYRLHILTLVSHLFIYNTTLTLKCLEELKVMIPVCQNFFSFLSKYSEADHFRSLIYGISTLIGTEELPEIIKTSIPKILESLVIIMKRYTRERVSDVKANLEDKKMFLQDKNEDVSQIETAIDKLGRKNYLSNPLFIEWESEYEKNISDDEDDEQVIGDDDYMWSRTDSNYYKSWIEEQEAPLFFQNILKRLREEREEYYNAIISVISEENKALIEATMERCEFIQACNM